MTWLSRWLPRTLFGRLALLVVGLVIVSQVFTLGLLGYSRAQLVARQLSEQAIDALAELESALDQASADERAVYLDLYNRPYSINLLPIATAHPPVQTPDEDHFASFLAERLVADHVSFTDARFQNTPKRVLWIKVSMLGDWYWLTVPLGEDGGQLRWTFLTAVLGFGAVALAGAFVFAWYLNRPLKRLAEAARQLAQGKYPERLSERGVKETRTLAQSFNRMSTALEQAEDDRRIMLAGISHDVRTPLTRLRLGVEMMSDDSLRDGMLTDLGDIERIVRQFRDFIGGEPEEAVDATDLNVLVTDVCQRYRREGVPIDTHLAGELPLLSARPLSMQRLLSNLIDNARRYGAPPLELSTGQADGRVWLAVRDHGPGVPKDAISQLTQPFVRLDPARQADGGSGLGLAIVKRIVDVHGATLWLHNHAEGGFEARITF